MRRIARHPLVWLGAFVIWFGVLWWLSSQSNPHPPGPEFENKDKVMHFGYFFGGAGLLSCFFYRLNPERPNWRKTIILTVVTIAIVGAIDEFHQTFTPQRSGNDPADWAADVLGAVTGVLVFRKAHRLLA